MTRGSNAAEVLGREVGMEESYQLFEGWEGLSAEQLAECEQAEADLLSGRVAGVPAARGAAPARRDAARMKLDVVWGPQALAVRR